MYIDMYTQASSEHYIVCSFATILLYNSFFTETEKNRTVLKLKYRLRLQKSSRAESKGITKGYLKDN